MRIILVHLVFFIFRFDLVCLNDLLFTKLNNSREFKLFTAAKHFPSFKSLVKWFMLQLHEKYLSKTLKSIFYLVSFKFLKAINFAALNVTNILIKIGRTCKCFLEKFSIL